MSNSVGKYDHVEFAPTEHGGWDFYTIWADTQEELDEKLRRFQERSKKLLEERDKESKDALRN